MPAPLQVASGTSATTTVSATWPGAVTDGSLLVAGVMNTDNFAQTPSGWQQDVQRGDFGGIQLYSRIADGTETSLSVTLNGAGSGSALFMAEFAHNGSTGILDKTASAGSGTSATTSQFTGTTATTDTADELAVAIIGWGGGANVNTPGYLNTWTSGFVSAGTPAERTACGMAMAYRDLTATGAYATQESFADSNKAQGCIGTYRVVDPGNPVPPTYVGAGTAAFTATSGASLAPGLPTGWAADDIHILVIATSSNTDIPEPSGWTKLSPSAAAENNTAAQRVELWWRRAVGGDTAPSVANMASTAVRGARIYGVRGCPTAGDPFSAQTRSNNAASATVSTASATPADDLTLGLFLYAYEDDPSAASQPTNWSTFNVATSALGNDMALGVATRTLTSASAQNPSTTVSGGTFANSPNVGILLFLKAATAATATAPPPFRRAQRVIYRNRRF